MPDHSEPPPPSSQGSLGGSAKPGGRLRPSNSVGGTSAAVPTSSPAASRTASPTRQSAASKHTAKIAANTSSASHAPHNSHPSATVQTVSTVAQPELQRIANKPPQGSAVPSSRPQHSAGPSSPAPSVPPSPRLKSPPPTVSRRSSVSSSRLSDSDTSDAARSTAQQSSAKAIDVSDRSPSPTRTPQSKAPRGPGARASKLETVQEGDHSASPKEPSALVIRADEEAGKQTAIDPDATPKRSATAPQNVQAQLDSKQMRPETPTRKRSTSSLAAAKSRTSANEGSSKMMTVETETVSSIPQTAIANTSDRTASARGEGSNTLRGKPSHETVRNKKDKRKVSRKPQSTAPGSSKADIFEAKVASEIEGEGSDSDETFVYESNPQDARARHNKQHSRTPSNASLHTLADRKPGTQRGGGSLHSEDGPVRPKRSMKFASSGYTGSMEDESGDANPSRAPATRADMRRELHGKRLGRREPTYDSSADNESPFSQASRLKVATGTDSRNSLKSNSPRSATPTQSRTPVKKGHSDLEYDSSTALDERTPLMGSLRTHKTRNPRMARHSRLEDLEYYGEARTSWTRRVFGYAFALLLTLLLLASGGGLLYLTARPLYGVSIQEIRNVLASEQEIMLDLLVQATNPNIAQISVRDMDVNIFAKSRHISDNATFVHGRARPLAPIKGLGGVDEGTDPIEDPDSDHQTMLLGRIFHFDSALQFEPSPLRRIPQKSTGELRLAHPGNKTETGGSARWERVLQHQFILIVRGVLKYEIPLSTQMYTSSVGARVLVKPEEGVDDGGNLKVVQLDHLPPLRNMP